ncbi:Uncharacterised protein [Mycobacteroides abscessus subsp. abscessus]|nr:Uncharacterised protein [Mycobacteroides abscessus subsp. abscessus]
MSPPLAAGASAGAAAAPPPVSFLATNASTIGVRIGSSCLIRSLFPAPAPASFAATSSALLSPNSEATTALPACWSTSSTFTPPSRSVLGALLTLACKSAALSGSSALACSPPTNSGTTDLIALSAVSLSTPSFAAI